MMKKNLLYVTTLVMALLFTACGESSTSESKVEDNGKKDVLSATDTEDNATDGLMTPSSKNINMKIGNGYIMKKGESIVKLSQSPKIELKTNTKTGETTATLLEGEAKIKKGSFIPSF
jgi:major membrane immunogen (membrane-anchored lipoprotein)